MDGLELIWDGLYPPGLTCLSCGQEGPFAGSLCPECAREVNPIRMGTCPVCGRPTGRRHVCGPCRRMKPPILEGMAVYGYYGMPRELLLRCKFRGDRYLIPFLAEQMAARVRESHMTFDVVVPVPSHRLRRISRGYCVAEELAVLVAKDLGLPLKKRVLRRVRWRRSRFRLKKRWNVKMALDDYAVRQAAPIEGHRVLLVDDVLTGGATLTACARHLMDAGAASVTSVVVAAAPKVRYNVRSKGSVVASRSQSRAKRST